MKSRILTIYLTVAVSFCLVIFGVSFTKNIMLPDNQQGYEPIQPIEYSHRLHAGELGISCLHCHFNAERGRTAGIPPTQICMNCHKIITAPFLNIKEENDLAMTEKRKPRLIVSSRLRKMYDAVGLNEHLLPDQNSKPTPIEWVRVHSLQSFVYFNHSRHLSVGIDCQTCHGEIETMERVRQVSDLSMGWCVNCHRDATANGINGKKVFASTDCNVCHQ